MKKSKFNIFKSIPNDLFSNSTLANTCFSQNNKAGKEFTSNHDPTSSFKPAIIKRSDNTIGLPEELIYDQENLDKNKKKRETDSSEVAAGDDLSDDNTIAKESKNLNSVRTVKGDTLATTETKTKSFPHGRDKI